MTRGLCLVRGSPFLSYTRGRRPPGPTLDTEDVDSGPRTDSGLILGRDPSLSSQGGRDDLTNRPVDGTGLRHGVLVTPRTLRLSSSTSAGRRRSLQTYQEEGYGGDD